MIIKGISALLCERILLDFSAQKLKEAQKPLSGFLLDGNVHSRSVAVFPNSLAKVSFFLMKLVLYGFRNLQRYFGNILATF